MRSRASRPGLERFGAPAGPTNERLEGSMSRRGVGVGSGLIFFSFSGSAAWR